MKPTRPALTVLALVLAASGCSRQFAVTVNNRSVYDPRLPAQLLQVVDSDLQGCINLAVQQQGISNPAELTVLSCAAANVTDLEGIDQFRNLRFLDLAGNNFTDLRPLTSLPQLTGLSIPDNPVTDIAPLLAMESLTAVILTGNVRIPCTQLDRLEERLGSNLTRPATCRS